MRLKSAGVIFGIFIHATALGCAANGAFLFLASSIDNVASAMLMLGAAIALEVIAAVIANGNAAPTRRERARIA